MNDEADILDAYYNVIDNDPRCRNIKNAERHTAHAESHSAHYHKKVSLATVPSPEGFRSFLQSNFDITIKEFLKLLKLELKLHKFALKHKHIENKVYMIKKCLFNRKYKLVTLFKDLIPSNFVTKWIYWNKCKTIAYSLDTILLMSYDTFIVIYDQQNSRRCIYRTSVNSEAAPTLLVGSRQAPMFAYAETGIYYPNIFVVGYPDLRTISKLRDRVKGKYIGLKFGLKKVLITLKAGYETTGLKFTVWNWTKGEKIVIYDQLPSKSIFADCTMFNWEESLGVGVMLQRNITYNDDCQLVNIIYATVFRQKLYEKLTIIYKIEESFYQSFVPKDACFVSEESIYIVDEKADLYLLEGMSTLTLILKKKWTLKQRRPKGQVRLVSYRNGFLIFGPEGVLKMYNLDHHKEWHCSWWMDLYDVNVLDILVFGRPEFLYVLCPFNGILSLDDNHSDNNSFKTIYKFEKDIIKDIILVQPACKYMLAVCDRRNIQVFTVDACKPVGKMSFPEKYDKFPYLANPCYPYIIFISNRIGKFFIYDIEDYTSPFEAGKILIGPSIITRVSFSNCGMLLKIWMKDIERKLIYWAVNTNKTYDDIKVILNLSSADNAVEVCPYMNSAGEFFVLILEKNKPHLGGNRVFFYTYPKKELVGECTLNNNYNMLYFTWQSMNCIYGSLASCPQRFVKFSFTFKKFGKRTVIDQSRNSLEFVLPHEGKFELFYGFDYTFSYGLEDGMFMVLNMKEENVKRIFSGYFHRGVIVNYEHNKFSGGGIKKCFGTKCGNYVVVLGQNGTLTGHKFRICRREGPSIIISRRLDIIKNMKLFTAESCMSISLATGKYPRKRKIFDTLNIRHAKKMIAPVSKSKKKIDFSGIEDYTNTAVQNPDMITDEDKIKLVRKQLKEDFFKIGCILQGMFRAYYHSGRMTLPFPLFILKRNDMREFFRRINDIEVHTEANIKRRMAKVMKEIVSWVKVFRDPFNNAQLIRGILNPEIKAWSVGTRISPQNNNWRKLCEKQWKNRKVLHCGYHSTPAFPINPIMQKRIEVEKETFPNTSCLKVPEVLYVSRRTVGGFKESDMRTINKTIQEAAFLKNLRASLEFYNSGSNVEGTCNPYQSLIDYESLWKKLCTKDTYEAVNSFNDAINEVLKEDGTRMKNTKHTKDLLNNLLHLNHGQYYKIKDGIICNKCKNVPIYSNCSHKPKCYPCFHGLKCILSKYVFPETTRLIRAPDVSPSIFCKPMRYINYYRFVLHPHIECCSFDPKKGIEVSPSRTDEVKEKKTVEEEKPEIIKSALMITNKQRELPPRNIKVFSKSSNCNKGDIIWDEALEDLVRICGASNDCELLLRKLYFKCSQRPFCDSLKQYLLLKSMKHLMKYTSFFPLPTYLALPWLRELVQEVMDLKQDQKGDYKKLIKIYPDILIYKKTEYHDPFKIPEWWDKFMKMIAEARKSLNFRLAKVYVLASYENLFPKEDDSDVSSQDSVDSEMAKSPADVICGYEKVPSHQIIDVGLNEEVFRYGETKVKKVYPASERLTTRTYNDTFKKQFMEPLEEHYLLKWRNSNQLYHNPRLTMSLTRYDESKYMNPEKDEVSSCEAFENSPDCITKRLQGTVDLQQFYLDKGNLIYNPNLLYKVENNPENTETIILPSNNNYRIVPVTNLPDPFIPVQPHHPTTKYWRPFTLKWLLSLKKPLSPRLLSIVNRLASHEIPSEIHEWFKTYAGLINKIQRIIKNRLLNFDMKKINKLQYHEYTKLQKLVYPIKLIETAQWLALIIHKLTIINEDIIDSTEKVMSSFCGAPIYKNHPMRLPKGRYPIKGKPFDPRKAFKLVAGPRFPNHVDNSLIEDLNKTNQLNFFPKMYEPQDDLRQFLGGPVKNSKYVLKLLINRQILQMCASKAKLHNAPKEWFTWRPLQQGAPNWVMIVTVAIASKLLCRTLSNITRRLYKILRDAKKYICRKAAEQNLKKRVNVEDTVERNYDQMGQGFITNEELEKMVWEQPEVKVDYTPPDNAILSKYSGTTPRNVANLMTWRKHEQEFLGRVKRKRLDEKLRMEVEVEHIVKADEKGWEMYLDHKRYWAAGFRIDPLRAGFPPVYDKKNRAIIDFGNNYGGCLGANACEVCPQRSIKAKPQKEKDVKQKKSKKKKKKIDGRIKRKMELLFMKRLIIDGPTVRYTTINNYYSNRFEYFAPINSKDFANTVMLTVETLSKERDRLLGGLRTVKHHIINFMLLLHIKREHIKKKLSYFCECDDFYTVYYRRQVKLIPDEKLNHLYQVDDEDNRFYRNGREKERIDPNSEGIIQTKLEMEEPFIDKELTRIMGGTMTQNYLTSLKSPFLKPPCFHITGTLREIDQLKIERNIKKGIILEKERDLTVMEFKRQMSWFSIYKDWFKWSFDYLLAYHGVFQFSGIENSIKAEEMKLNSIQKVKWEIRKLILSMDKIRKSYLVNTTEYLYVRTTILSDIEYFRKIHSEMIKVYEETEKITAYKEDLKIRILRENPYLKESTLDHLLTPKISVELLNNVSVQDLKNGYKFYYLKKKPVYHFYQLNPKITEYYQQVRSLHDVRLYPLMNFQLRRELNEIRVKQQKLYYKIHTGQKKTEEFYARLSKAYKYAADVLHNLKRLHLTCYRKLNLLKKVINQQRLPVSIYRKQLDQPLWELVKPYAECKEVRFVAISRHKSHPKLEEIKFNHRFKETLLTDRIEDLFAIRKTLVIEIKLKKLYLKLVKIPPVRYLDGANEDMVQHYKEYIKKSREVCISTQIKGYDKTLPKLHLGDLISNYLKFIRNKKCLEFERKMKKKKKKLPRKLKIPPACKACKRIEEAHQSNRYNIHFGALCWFVKGSWEISDFKQFYKNQSHFKTFIPDNIESNLKRRDTCSLVEHSNKVYDFLRALIVPSVPPPSPAGSQDFPKIVKMMAAGEDDDTAYQQDELIFQYLRDQVQKLATNLKEENKSLVDIEPREMETIFRKWINKLFDNWHVRIPSNIAAAGDKDTCSLVLKEFANIQTRNLHGFLVNLIENHSSQLEKRNIERVKSDIAFTEHEIMLKKCVEHMSTLEPPVNIKEVAEEGSGTEKKCNITVYAKFENNLDYTLSEEQYLLILNLVSEHMKKYNKDFYIQNGNCSHVDNRKNNTFKDWISFAFGKIFLNPVQYVFIKSGERLIKMYDKMENFVKLEQIKTKKLKTREMIISFLKEYRELERDNPNIHIAYQLAEEERTKVREPLLFKWTALKKELEHLQEQNKRLQSILIKEKKRTYPIFGKVIIPMNEKLAELLD